MLVVVVFLHFFERPDASKRSDHAAISENRIDHNGGAGIMVDRSSDYCTISGNLIYRNGDAGVVFFETSSCAVHSNTIQRNLCELYSSESFF